VDLAVIAVPINAVLGAVHECGAAGVGSLVIISSGFGETGSDGAAKERELLDVARSYGMRLVGPNCMGVINTDPAIRLNTTFAPSQPRPGTWPSSPSRARSEWRSSTSLEAGIGLSGFVSAGNKIDISGNDLLQYWSRTPAPT